MSTCLSKTGPDWCEIPAQAWDALAHQHGTPFYLFDADAVGARIRAVRDALRGQAQVYYAVKANPNLGLLKAVREVADGVDISSGGELSQALLAGYAPEHMSFAGPSKTADELEAAIRAGVGCISVESLREIQECARLAGLIGQPARILLRVNPLLSTKAYGLKMGGRAVQFGIDEEALPQAEALVMQHAGQLDFCGVHCYVGSQCFEAAGVVEATCNALRIAQEITRRSGLVSRKINLGGGFGLAHAPARRELDLVQLAQGLQPVLDAYRQAHPACALIFELGRFITAEAGIYVTRVVSTKMSRGKAFVACDGGLNHHLAAAGTFGAALRSNFPMHNLSRPEAPQRTCHVAGASCNPTDLLGVDSLLPDPQAGDLLGVGMSGSYGLTASPLMFLGRPTPVELVLVQGTVSVGRRSHTIVDFN